MPFQPVHICTREAETHIHILSQDWNKDPQVCLLQVNNEILRENLERIVGRDDSAFSGIDLATLIRNKYGRSYDVQLIKKVRLFMCNT